MDNNRYSRQELFAPIGKEGQKKLKNARVAVLGAGALGTVILNNLVRAGVGFIRLVDRDYVETSNLNRQILFDEDDAREMLPKVEAAKRKLKKINSEVVLESFFSDITSSNIESFTKDVDLIMDGTDNFELRFLINDVAVKYSIPWVYGACIGSQGIAYSVIPQEGPCLRCLTPNPPAQGKTPTCDLAGILGATVSITASLQTIEAMKILVGNNDDGERKMTSFDVWTGSFNSLNTIEKREECLCCSKRNFEFLDAISSYQVTSLCGRNAVQISAPKSSMEIEQVRESLKSIAQISDNGFFISAQIESYEFVIFPDGRVVIKGTSEPSVARMLYAKYIGM